MFSTQNKLLLLARIKSRQIRIARNRERIQYLKQHPETLTEEDLDMLVDADGRQRRWLFTHQPALLHRYEQFRDTPEMLTSRLHTFVQRAWIHCKIGKPFVDNWHHLVWSEVIGKMAKKELLRAIFAVPPGTGKSLWHGVFKPAWRWAIDPTERLAYFSYSDMVPGQTRDYLSNLLNSPWYRRRWGHRFVVEKDGKDWIKNSRGGWRFGQGYSGGGTGAHPDWIDIDDPNKGRDSSSLTKFRDVVRWFSNTVASRGAGEDCRISIEAQRLSTSDLIGRVIGEHGGNAADEIGDDVDIEGYSWEHVCLPMRFKANHRYRYHGDPRTFDGELLWPARYDARKVARMQREMELSGEPNVQAQLDQDPLSSQATLFENLQDMWIAGNDLPPCLSQCRAVRAWDRAGTENGGDWTVGVLMVQHGERRYILDVIRVQKEPTTRDNLIETVALQDARRFEFYRVVNERMIGPDGKQVHTNLHVMLARHSIECIAQDPVKDKQTRARPVAASIKYRATRVLKGKPWQDAMYDELRLFPNGAHDDIVDAMAHAYNALNQWEKV